MYRLIFNHFIAYRVCETVYRHIRKFPVPDNIRSHPYISFCFAIGGALHHIKQKATHAND